MTTKTQKKEKQYKAAFRHYSTAKKNINANFKKRKS